MSNIKNSCERKRSLKAREDIDYTIIAFVFHLLSNIDTNNLSRPTNSLTEVQAHGDKSERMLMCSVYSDVYVCA